jgi:maltooligosyltrehalose trehalohydrolase
MMSVTPRVARATVRASRPEPDATPWRLPLGAEVRPDAARFRVWAPKRERVEVVLDGGPGAGQTAELIAEPGGYFQATVRGACAGTRYRYRLDGDALHPDPCSRYQPDGPEGSSLVVDPSAFRWTDDDWRGVALRGQVVYEMHVGTFTREGTLDAAARELTELQRLGVTLIELMPLAEFPGRFNWGYDGVSLYAPYHGYGDPGALCRFVDQAHALGLGVILDVVYNHLGPSGCCLPAFSDDIFTDRYENEWGEAINFDGDNAAGVREYFIENACYWVSEFHLDGLRLDATQSMHDASPVHVLAEISARARAAAGRRSIVLIGENEPQDVRYVAPVERGGYGLDALWSDDFHHSVRVAATGRREAYYTDYRGAPQELVSLVKRGYLYQGQRYRWQQKRRGTRVTDEPASAFVFYLQNHDQVANHRRGTRLHALTSGSRYRALTALLLLAPETPLVFMGQEFAASSPFEFFADHRAELAGAVRRGRREFLGQFPSYGTAESEVSVPDPADVRTFERSKLDLSERTRHAEVYRLHEDLLRVRRTDAVITAQARDRVDGAVLGPASFVLRWSGGDHGDRLLLINLGPDDTYDPAPEPLLAPVPGGGWHVLWSSEDPRYGGPGVVDPWHEESWRFPAESATLFTSIPASE